MSSCFSCGAALDSLPLPIGRRETCPKCSADVKVCKNCHNYDPRSYNECRESMAERVLDKEKSNACDYFRLGGNFHKTSKDEAEEARRRLDDLFKNKS